ncbi:type IV fimbrial biogenesis protein FimT [Gammaproteobacteria bacterium]
MIVGAKIMRRELGFTLTEIMVTLGVAGIVLVIGVPSLRSVMQTNQVVAHSNDFLSALSRARSEAVTKGFPVVVCRSLSNVCQTTTTYGWEQGWMIFVDANNNATFDSGEVIVDVHPSFEGKETLVGDTNVKAYISYSSDGVTRLIDGTSQTGTLTSSLCIGQKKNTIQIGTTGRARIQKISC